MDRIGWARRVNSSCDALPSHPHPCLTQVCVALITREVDSCQALMAGTLTAEGLKSLEQAVAKAVSAAIPKLPPMMSNGSTMPPRRGNPKTDFAVDLKKHADWTEVGRYRSNYFAVEQQRRAETRQARPSVRRTGNQ